MQAFKLSFSFKSFLFQKEFVLSEYRNTHYHI
jgi:hypothetical protein